MRGYAKRAADSAALFVYTCYPMKERVGFPNAEREISPIFKCPLTSFACYSMFRLPKQFYLIRYRVIHLIWGPRKFSICGESEGSSRPNVAERHSLRPACRTRFCALWSQHLITDVFP